MQPILWLNELQDTHLAEVGVTCLQLRQLQAIGCPIQEGFVLPSSLFDYLVNHITWQDTLLQDFPHLNLKFDLKDPLATQELVSSIQDGICHAPIPTLWQTAYSHALSKFHSGWLMLKPYLWAEQSDQSSLPISPLFATTARYCQNQPTTFLTAIQQLWTEVFDIQNILLLQSQGMHLAQVRVSLLVQPLPTPIASGWLQIKKNHGLIQAILGSPQGLWVGESLPEQWVIDLAGKVLSQESGEQSFAHWLRSSPRETIRSEQVIAPPQPIPQHQQQAPILALETVQALTELARSLSQISSPSPITLTWTLHRPSHCRTRQLLAYYIDSDLPLPPPSYWHADTRDAVVPAPAQTEQPDVAWLLKGMGVSSGQRIAPLRVVQSLQDIQPESLADFILVTPTLDTMHLPWLRAAAGCICETGSPVSHGAILSRELGCPAIMGVQGATQALKTGQWVRMDGQSGYIYPHTDSASLTATNNIAQPPSQTQKTCTKLLATISHPDRLAQLNPQTVDGIGLIRGEWLMLNSIAPQAPSTGFSNLSVQHWQQCQQSLRQFIQAVTPSPVFYRLIDFGAIAPEAVSAFDPNRFLPDRALGVPLTGARPACRGIGCHLLDHQLLHAELRMIREIATDGITNLHLILPFVRSVQEVIFVQEQLREAGLQTGIQPPLWIMAEVPSVVYLLDQYAQMNLQGIAIGLNDFTQLLLGADRNHPDFWDCLQTNQSVVMSAVTELVKKAHQLGFQTMLCGELKPYPAEFLTQLMQAGLDAVTVGLSDLDAMHTAIAQAELKISSPSVTDS
jgi:pyruvate, water dikinase